MRTITKNAAIFAVFYACSFASLHSQIRSDFVLVPEGEMPHIVRDEDGELHATWWSVGGIHYGFFDSLGNSLQVTRTISGRSLTENPRLALSEEHVVVMWTSFLPGFFSHINGLVFNRESGNVIGCFEDLNGDNSHPDVRYINDSTFVTVWAGDGPYTPRSLLDIYGQVFKNSLDSLHAIGDTLLFTDDLPNPYRYFHPRIAKNQAYGSTNVFWVAQDSLLGWSVFGRRLTKDGTLQNSSFMINENSIYTKAWGLSAVMDIDGNFAVAWSAQVGDTSWNVYLRRFNADGLPSGPTAKISEEAVGRFAEVDIAMDHDGTHVIVWEELQDKRKIFAQRFAADGRPVGTNFRASMRMDTLIQVSPSVVLNNGKIYIAWAGFETIHARGTLWANILDFNNPKVGVKRQPGNPVRSFY